MSRPLSTGRLRSRRAVTVTAWLALLSLPLLSIQACAETESTSVPRTDNGVIIPTNDAGAEASPSDDAAAEAAAPVPCAVGNLCTVPTPLTIGSIAALSGRSKDDVWASGSSGLLLRWDGKQWASLEADSRETLTSIFLTPDEMWGVSGSLVVRRGVDASTIRTTRWNYYGLYRYLTGIAVLANGDPYLLVAAPWDPGTAPDSLVKLVDFDAGQTESMEPPVISGTELTQDLSPRALFLVPNRALWIVGDRGQVARYPVATPEAGVVLPVDSQANLLAAWGYDDHLWAAGSNGAILHYDGATWHTESSGTNVTLRAIFGFSSNDIWAAGDEGTVLHFDGKSWSRISVGTYDGALRAIWGSAPDDVWIGGAQAMFHWGALR
ncbi:MAG: hypothetical protein BGO98_15815 [Myxococcales bacterium 68-20]|nr:MAG: hypothetical protein BGO98_15815 [Myxococcales bacterium 68-20]